MQNESAINSAPFQLRLLGSPRIEGPQGALSGPASQRHRLALLAALALAPRNLLPRDRLLGLLWPETDTANARQLLNAAVHAIRRALGDDTIVTESEALRLNNVALRIDVLEFERALKQGDAAAAIDLYAGPFLDGFSLPEAVEFEQWQELERDRLERLHHSAMEQQADAVAARGDLAEAVRLWRRRVASTPTEGRVVIRLMQVLAQAGDRAGAIQLASVHSKLLEQELGIGPDPDVQRAAEQIQKQPSSTFTAPAPARAVEKPQMETVSAAAAQVVPAPRRARSRRGLITISAVIGVLAVTGWMLQMNRRAAGSVPVVNSVAVLPFVDMSPGKEQQHLASGVAEGILNALANVPGLNVPARSSSFQFKGEGVDLRDVADRLHVDAVLEGSVQLSGDRLRINAQLAHPRSGYQLFSKQYDGSVSQVFELQDQIAKDIVEEVQVHRHAGADPQLVKSATRDFTAYNLYLRGLQAAKTTTGDSLQRAIQYLEEATRIDPTFALAYAGLADAFVALADHGYLARDLALPRARDAVDRALQLDSASAEAHTALGHMANGPGKWEEAERSFRRAIQLRPGYAAAHMWLGNNLMVRGNTKEGLQEFQRASDLDPLSPSIASGLSQALYISGDVAGAVTTARRATEMAPAYPWGHATLAGALTAQGDFAEATTEAQKAVQLSGEHPNALAVLAAVQARAGQPQPARQILARLNSTKSSAGDPAAQALIHANLGELDRAFALLNQLTGLNSAAREWLRVNPIWQPLREDARWPQLLRSLGLEQ